MMTSIHFSEYKIPRTPVRLSACPPVRPPDARPSVCSSVRFFTWVVGLTLFRLYKVVPMYVCVKVAPSPFELCVRPELCFVFFSFFLLLLLLFFISFLASLVFKVNALLPLSDHPRESGRVNNINYGLKCTAYFNAFIQIY